MLLTLFAYSLVPTIIMFVVLGMVKARILLVSYGSCLSQLIGFLLIFSTLFTVATGTILLAQTILA